EEMTKNNPAFKWINYPIVAVRVNWGQEVPNCALISVKLGDLGLTLHNLGK
ncbi:hypothetical protein THIOM_003086, partial [Candidatus Thiomargarita nelsonii]